jgi:tetratricopeptide (TPR) repeat protein
MSTNAAVLDAMGRASEADSVMDKALALPNTSMFNMYIYRANLLRAKRSGRALKVFQLDQQRHPEEKFWTYLGLARSYTALGDKPNAIKNWEIAIANLPENRKFMLPQFEASLKKLKEGS